MMQVFLLKTLSDIVLALDLDDTLYQEFDYMRSGLLEVRDFVFKLYGIDVSHLFDSPDTCKDYFQLICDELKFPSEFKETLVWIYRLHSPKISLCENVRRTLEYLKSSGAEVVVLTDGRSASQRLKLQGLGLEHLPAFISEEWGEVKPGLVRFTQIMKSYENSRYYYVGDNPSKDFFAPNQLGWTSIMIKACSRNIHEQKLPDNKDYHPKITVDTFQDLVGVLC